MEFAQCQVDDDPADRVVVPPALFLALLLSRVIAYWPVPHRWPA